jgi:hypothetical protein
MLSLQCNATNHHKCQLGDLPACPCDCPCHRPALKQIPDLPKGAPFRQVRQQASYLLSGADEATMRAALVELVFSHPDKVLTALANAIEKREGF